MKKIYQKLLEGIPDYKEFLTVEEMNSSSKNWPKSIRRAYLYLKSDRPGME